MVGPPHPIQASTYLSPSNPIQVGHPHQNQKIPPVRPTTFLNLKLARASKLKLVIVA